MSASNGIVMRWEAVAHWARRQAWRRLRRPQDLFDGYVEAAPSAQTAVDAVPGWTTALPPGAGAVAGTMPLFADDRIAWAIAQAGGVEGKRVLEIGPLDGAHTAMLVRAGAQVEAVEANRMAFLRCLVMKEILGLERARFHLGDAVRFLEEREDRWDLVVASGVLYHMRDPVRFLELLRLRGRAVYLWTHYYDPQAMSPDSRGLFAPSPLLREHRGRTLRLWRRTYEDSPADPRFCGGLRDEHYWMEREDIEWVLGEGGGEGDAVVARAHDDGRCALQLMEAFVRPAPRLGDGSTGTGCLWCEQDQEAPASA